ncbi:Charged multivesicular body protein 7 [Porphyridium purpureum]|uniref:Charged multivesicular body protein 7 n=1 Tax=Porphyridium purpureum TaxID=35688 RepID=A0A5J4YZQ3_PORPP|nr:Charged multivesicular body protein 7 [Porphyridium purpureum]|eukprot:POR2528..scf209_3
MSAMNDMMWNAALPPEREVDEMLYDSVHAFFEKRVLESCVRKHGRLVWSPAQMFGRDELQRHGRPPACFQDVLQRMFRDGLIVPLHALPTAEALAQGASHASAPKSTESAPWITRLYRGIAGYFMASAPAVPLFDPADTESQFVMPMAVKARSSELFDRVLHHVDRHHLFGERIACLWTLHAIAGEFCDSNITECSLLVGRLAKDGQCRVFRHTTSVCADDDPTQDLIGVRFLGKDASLLSIALASDSELLALISARDNLRQKCDVYQGRISSLRQQASNALKDPGHVSEEARRAAAKRCIVQKQELERHHERFFKALCNVDKILYSIDMADSNAQVMGALRVGESALAQINSEVDVSEVDDMMLDLEEQLQKVAIIGDALAAPGPDTAQISNDDLDKELDALMFGTAPASGPTGGLGIAQDQAGASVPAKEVPAALLEVSPEPVLSNSSDGGDGVLKPSGKTVDKSKERPSALARAS